MSNAIETIDRLDAITMMEQTPMPAPVTYTSPITLLRIAVERGTNMEQLERLMALQVSWEQREAEKAYNRAFAAFKAEAVKIIRNRAVTAGPLNGKKYAELFAVVNAVTPALSAHGLSASWKLTKDEKDWLEVTCTLKHEDGHFETVSMGGPPDAGGAKNAIQARASTVSYLERYTLKAITGLSEQDEDDDGGIGDEGPAAEMIAKARAATTDKDLNAVVREGVAKFKNDKASYSRFQSAVTQHRATLQTGGANA